MWCPSLTAGEDIYRKPFIWKEHLQGHNCPLEKVGPGVSCFFPTTTVSHFCKQDTRQSKQQFGSHTSFVLSLKALPILVDVLHEITLIFRQDPISVSTCFSFHVGKPEELAAWNYFYLSIIFLDSPFLHTNSYTKEMNPCSKHN